MRISRPYIIAMAMSIAAVLTACNKTGQQQDAAAATDSLLTSSIVRHVVDSSGTYTLAIALPERVKGQEQLAGAVSEWVNEILGGTYGESCQNYDEYLKALTDTAALIDHFFKNTVKKGNDEFADMKNYNPDATEWEISFCDSIEITKCNEGAHWVTFDYTRDLYIGGAHGTFTILGQTFRIPDGRRIGWDIIKNPNDEEFLKLLKEGMMEYFGAKSEQELGDYLMGEGTPYYIPLPRCQPLFSKEGICFVYNQYEIAAYAAGLPTFTIPWAKLEPFLNVTAKQLLK